MPLVRPSWLACMTLALAAACGGGGDDDGDDTPPPIDASTDTPDAPPGTPDAAGPTIDAGSVTPSLAKICNPTDGYVVRLQQKLEECAGYTLAELSLFGGLTPAETAAFCDGSAAPYVDDGTVALADGAAFAACEDYLNALTCESWALQNPCTGLLVGQSAASATCFESLECATGSACIGAPSGTVCRTCTTTLRPNGGLCGSHAECASGYCAGCFNGPCQATCADPPVGAAPGAACDPFAGLGNCAGAYFCRMQADGTDKCAKPPTGAVDGQPCRNDFDCGDKQTGLYCANVAPPGMSPSYQCKPFVALGDACQNGITKCNKYLGHGCLFMAGMGFRCTAVTPAGFGAICGTEQPCGAGLACDPQVFTCKNARTEGQTVSSTTDLCTAGTHPVVPLGGGPSTCEYSNHHNACSPS